jgi:hypothetical protein
VSSISGHTHRDMSTRLQSKRTEDSNPSAISVISHQIAEQRLNLVSSRSGQRPGYIQDMFSILMNLVVG